jgi:hypothetical protein
VLVVARGLCRRFPGATSNPGTCVRFLGDWLHWQEGRLAILHTSGVFVQLDAFSTLLVCEVSTAQTLTHKRGSLVVDLPAADVLAFDVDRAGGCTAGGGGTECASVVFCVCVYE